MVHVIVGLVVAAVGFAATRSWFASGVAGAVTLIFTYLSLPTLAWNFEGLWILVGLGLLIVAGLALLVNGPGNPKPAILAALAAFFVGTMFFTVSFFTTWSFFHDNAYQKLLGEVRHATFSTDATVLDQSQIRNVDFDVAHRRAEELLGSDPGLGSKVKIGDMRKQIVRGEQVWVAPLEYKGFRQWWGNDFTPGYVQVNANNFWDAKLVTEVGGKPIRMRIGEEGYLADNLHRHVYNSGFAHEGLTDFSFEIDEDGNPFYVVTRYVRRVGFSGADAIGVAVVDPQSGETKAYGIADAPPWIDRIQPMDFVTDQIDDWGELVHGWYNPAGTDKVTSTTGSDIVYGKDGRAYIYTGVQSVGSQQGTTGFMLVDSRTKAATLYAQAGATEEQAVEAMLGRISNMRGWTTSWPLLYNIEGAATYVMTLKDASRNFKGIGMVLVANRAITAQGNDLRDALRQYANEVRSQGMVVGVGPLGQELILTGRVSRSGVEFIDGSTVYYFILDQHADQEIVVNAKVSPEVPVTQVGDQVSVSVTDSHEGVATGLKFDNHELAIRKSIEQRQVEQRHEAVQTQRVVNQEGQNADAAWEKLTPDEKRKLMQQRP